MAAPIDPALKAFLQGGVSLLVATGDANRAPALTRAGGCRVGDDGRVTLYLAAEQAGGCLENARATSRIALIAVQPHTWECYQVKGDAACVVDLDAADRARVAECRRLLFAALARAGVPQSQSAGLLPADPQVYVGIAFTPTEVHCNTPAARALEDSAP